MPLSGHVNRDCKSPSVLSLPGRKHNKKKLSHAVSSMLWQLPVQLSYIFILSHDITENRVECLVIDVTYQLHHSNIDKALLK